MAARVFVGKIAILHLDTCLEPFVLEPDRSHRTLRKPPLASAITSDFLFDKPIHCPFDPLADISRHQSLNTYASGISALASPSIAASSSNGSRCTRRPRAIS